MKYWIEYDGHVPNLIGKRKNKKFDNTIYSFDIETTSYIILDGQMLKPIEYLDLNTDDQERCIFQSNMYIWMFSINDTVYYGRTWSEFENFLHRIEYFSTKEKKFVFVHNLSFEFQFLRNQFKIKNVFSRKSRKVMKFELEDYNFEFRCTFNMSQCKLEKLPDIYQLPVEKLVGNLDYSLIRHSKTPLSDKELKYCENDCLVIYHYIKKELESYNYIKGIPLTSTGHVRKEFKDLIEKDWHYKNKVRKSVNTDGHIYNLLIDAFAGRIYSR